MFTKFNGLNLIRFFRHSGDEEPFVGILGPDLFLEQNRNDIAMTSRRRYLRLESASLNYPVE